MAIAKIRKLKRETESFLSQLKNRLCELMPSNSQFIRQAILHYVDSVMKRQSITYIISACSILVKRQYRKHHDKVETYGRLLLHKKHHVQCSNKWYKHTYARARLCTHTHTHTNHNQSREITNIKSFAISIFKQIKS